MRDNIIPNKVDNIGTELQQKVVNHALALLKMFIPNFQTKTFHLQYMIDKGFIVVHFLCRYEDKTPSTYSDLFPLSESIFQKLEPQMIAEGKQCELTEYYNKMAMIFQTAADKSERGEKFKTEWTIKAHEYLQKALVQSTKIHQTEYEERMKQLYYGIIDKDEYKHIRDILESLANQYEASVGITLASAPDERTSLLRHRTLDKIPS